MPRPKTKASRRPLGDAVALLEETYGRPRKPSVTDPFEMIVHESCAYLVDDVRRARCGAFRTKSFATFQTAAPRQLQVPSRESKVGTAGSAASFESGVCELKVGAAGRKRIAQDERRKR